MGGALRRAIGALATLALLAAAIGFYVVSPRTAGPPGPEVGTTAGPAATSSPAQPGSPSPTATPTRNRAEGAGPGSSPDRHLPPGPGGREPGIRLVATPNASGEFDVVETVRLAESVTQLTLSLPDLRSAGTDLQGKQPVAEGLKAMAGGQRIKLSNATVRRATVLPLAEPADEFELRYRLRGVTAISRPSSAGRALGAVGPMVTAVPEDLPVAITVRGHSVRNLSCPRLPLDDRACAAGPPPKVRVSRNLALRDALVVVQFDVAVTQVGAPR